MACKANTRQKIKNTKCLCTWVVASAVNFMAVHLLCCIKASPPPKKNPQIICDNKLS